MITPMFCMSVNLKQLQKLLSFLLHSVFQVCLVENYLDQELSKRLPGFDMKEFSKQLL